MLINYVNIRGEIQFGVKQATNKEASLKYSLLVNNKCKTYFFIPAYREDIILQLHVAILHIFLLTFYLQIL